MDDHERRAELHAALGEPVRLRIIEELARSDRAPGELGELLAIRGNLLAHHLRVLERVGLVERSVSAGDRRRRYLRLVREPLEHLDVTAAGPAPPAGPVVFVCTHNSARSPLAAALWNRRMASPATSAGTHPAERVHPRALAAAESAGLDLSGASPRLLDPSRDPATVITVCDQAHEELEPLHAHVDDQDGVAQQRLRARP
ncbi:MAG: helix-turn-helix domain-containing protein, partial [Acidimicrobiales bacterium]